jgi:hypothetical protein
MKTIRRMLIINGFLSMITGVLILAAPELLTYIAAIYIFLFGAKNVRDAYNWKGLIEPGVRNSPGACVTRKRP